METEHQRLKNDHLRIIDKLAIHWHIMVIHLNMIHLHGSSSFIHTMSIVVLVSRLRVFLAVNSL